MDPITASDKNFTWGYKKTPGPLQEVKNLDLLKVFDSVLHYIITACWEQGRRQKKFHEGGKSTEKDRKIALLSLFQKGGEATKKRPKNSKKRPKKALLSLYLLYLYHV